MPCRPPAEPPHRSRNPVDRLTQGLPHGMRITVDWIVTIAGAIAIVLAIKAWVVNPYRIPSSSMEPTLHCARPEHGCEARFSDRVLANRFIYRFRTRSGATSSSSRRRPRRAMRCGAGGTFVKRLIGLPGERLELRTTVGSATSTSTARSSTSRTSAATGATPAARRASMSPRGSTS